MFNLLFKETDQISCSTASTHPKARAQIWVKRTWLLNSYFSKSSSGQKSSRFFQGVVWVEGGSSFTKGAIKKQGVDGNWRCDPYQTWRPWWLKHHTGSRSSSLNSFNSHFLDHSTQELQERHTTTLCLTIHVSFQRSLDSHCVATFRYLSIMIWWFCCPSWMSSSDPLDLTTFSDLGSGSTNSTQSLWFRPWLCQVLASGMRHGFQWRL